MSTRPCPLFLAGAAAAGLLPAVGLVRANPAAPAAGRADLPPSTRGPVQIAFTPDGSRALVTEKDTATLAVLDARSGRLLRRIRTGGRGPEGVAPEGERFALVADPLAGTVSRVDLERGEVAAALRLPGEPSEAAVSADGRTAYVTLAGVDQVAVVELPGLRETARIAVGDRPRALALSGERLLVANLRSGELSVIDAASRKETRRIRLRGRNLRDVAPSADGRYAWITSQVPAETGVTWVANDVWVNSVFRVDLQTGTVVEGRLDQTAAAVPEPDSVVPLDGHRLALTASGCDEALIADVGADADGYFNPSLAVRQGVGARPRGLALTPDRKELWVANELSSTITVLDASSLKPVRTLSLGTGEGADPRLRGRYLFGNAGMTAGHQFTCNSCHPDGTTDGFVWEFVHVPDGLPARNTRNLRSGVAGTAPFRWTGREQNLPEFLQDEVTRLMHGAEQSPETLRALSEFIQALPAPENPLRGADGSFTAAAQRGKALFEGKAGCASCHAGPLAGGTGKRANVGTAGDTDLDVPHLRGVYESAPYLHDGRAHTLEQIFSRWNAQHKHGRAHELTAEELADVLSYVREL